MASEDEEFEFRLRAEREATPDTKPQESYSDKLSRTGEAFDKAAGTGLAGVGNTVAAAMDVGVHGLTSVAGDVAGAATSVVTQDPKKGEAVRKRISDVGAPTTEAGKAGEAYVGALTEPATKALDYVPKKLDEAGHPIMGQVARAAEDLAPGKSLTKAAKPVAEASAATGLLQRGRAAGYVFKPSEAGGKVGKVAEGMSGSPRLSIEGSLRNQKVTNDLAAKEIGIDGKITPASLAKAKKPHNEVYKQMGQIGDITTSPAYKADIAKIGRTPGKSFQKHTNAEIDSLRGAFMEDSFNSKDAVLKVRQLRASATKNMKAPDPVKNELGYAQRQVAEAIDNEMESQAISQGQVGLAQQYRQSRIALAKIHSVEGSLQGTTGHVSASKLARMQSKGVPLTGNLKLIADMADEYGEVMRDESKLKNKVPVTVLEGASGAIGAGLAAASHPVLGAATIGGMVARPLTRKALLSDLYQDRLAK